ncbi:MAG: hypothetical protein ACTSRK_05165 [Promethearchaeota archaeon]
MDGELNETTSSTSQQIWLHVNGTYLITVTAWNASGESDYSVAITVIRLIMFSRILLRGLQPVKQFLITILQCHGIQLKERLLIDYMWMGN